MTEGPSSSLKDVGNDNKSQKTEEARSKGSFFGDLLMGLRFYSRLPTGNTPHELPDLSRMALALPFASVIIAIVPALILLFGASLGLPSMFAATLAVATYVLATGAMAEDGIADTADGLFGGRTIEQRLDILKDSRHGTYGVAALVLFLILRVSALGAIAATSPFAAALVWVSATVAARSGSLWLTLHLSPARRDGASSAVGQIRKTPFLIGLGFAATISFILAAPFTSIIGIVFAAALLVGVAYGWSLVCAHLLGGQTGDLIGALQALLEIAALSAFIVFMGLQV